MRLTYNKKYDNLKKMKTFSKKLWIFIFSEGGYMETYLGIDYGGTKLLIGEADEEGNLLS